MHPRYAKSNVWMQELQRPSKGNGERILGDTQSFYCAELLSFIHFFHPREVQVIKDP
jgi:hypothetical protein